MSGNAHPPTKRFLGDVDGAAFLAMPRFVPHGGDGSGMPKGGEASPNQTPQPMLGSHLELGALITAAASARGHVRAVLKEWGLDELTDVTELLVSELVTNDVAATRSLNAPLPFPVHLWLHANRKRVLVTVWDAEPQPPILRTNLDEWAESGRGLQILDALSSRWGCYEPPLMGAHGRQVRLCEIPREAAF